MIPKAIEPVAYKDQAQIFPPSYLNFEELHLSYSGQDRYYIAEKLGYGKYSDVFKGYRKEDVNEPIVIKILKPVRFNKVYREVKILTNLFYGPFIMKLLDVSSVQNSKYPAFITEFGGVSLQSALQTLPIRQTKYFIGQLLLALHYCHIHAIIHRDVKGGNICVDLSKGRLTLLDFGLAEFYQYGSKLHHRVATRHYKSPELLCDFQLYDYSLDVWSTGAMLAGYIFAKQPFFKGQDNDDQLAKIVAVMGGEALLKFLQKYNVKISQQKIDDLKHMRKIPFSQFINASNKRMATPDAIDLLERMLQFDPVDRETCQQLLQHQWFDEVRDELAKSYLKEFQAIQKILQNNFKGIPEPCFPKFEYLENIQYPVPLSPNELAQKQVVDESLWRNVWIEFQRKSNEIGWQIYQKATSKGKM